MLAFAAASDLILSFVLGGGWKLDLIALALGVLLSFIDYNATDLLCGSGLIKLIENALDLKLSFNFYYMTKCGGKGRLFCAAGFGIISGLICAKLSIVYALAFIAGGMNVIYQMERLPLMVAILIHGGVLYISYLATYLLNGWLEWGVTPVLVFSGIFALGYLVIWAVIYSIIKRNTAKLNQQLKEKQRTAEN